jgi:hypothetical protein
MNDPETECIVMIGEIGGQLEADAAHWLKRMETVPVRFHRRVTLQGVPWVMQVQLLVDLTTQPKLKKKSWELVGFT